MQPKEIPADVLDKASQAELDAMEAAIEARQEAAERAFERAAERALAGTRNICERCGSRIYAARLKAIPTTTICIDCASRVR